MFNRLFGAFLNQGPLHLSKTRQQTNHQRSESFKSSGVDQSIEGPDVDSLLLHVSKAIDHLHLGPSQEVEFGDHQFISVLVRLQAGTQLVTFLQRGTRGHLLGEPRNASSTLQFIGLSSSVLEVLEQRAYPIDPGMVKTTVVTAVFGVLATQEFWNRGAAGIRTKSGALHLFSRFPYSSRRGTESNLKRSSYEGEQHPEVCIPKGDFFDLLPSDLRLDT